MISIGRIGAADAARYYLDRQAGCDLDYYTGAGEPRGRWLGGGAAAAGLTGELTKSGESALRAMLSGCGVGGDRLVGPVLRADPRSRLPAEPLVGTLTALSPDGLGGLLDGRMLKTVASAAARITQRRPATFDVDLVRKITDKTGLNPTALYLSADGDDTYGAALVHVGERVDTRRAGLDVTVSAPKTVSFLYGLGDPAVAAAARAAHDTAVGEVITYLQRHAATAVRGHHGDGKHTARIATAGLVVAAFEHRSSRAGDPQLHTHLVIPNLVQGADGRWSAIDTAAVYRYARTASSLYHAVLRGELTRTLGVGWTGVRNGVADIDGIPRSTVETFSKRRAQITATMTRRGESGAKAAQAACLDTRPAKTHTSTGNLRDRWRTEAATVGLDPAALAAVLGRSGVPSPPDLALLARHLFGPDGVTKDQTTFTRQDLAKAICEALPAGTPVRLTDVDRLVTGLVTHPDVIPVLTSETNTCRYTTRDLLATEQAALDLANETTRNRPDLQTWAALGDELDGVSLDAQQTVMVTELTTSRRAVEVVAGPAGSGKTAALAAAHHVWASTGHPVKGATVSWLAAQQLQAATGIETVSLAKLLHEADRHGLPAGCVLVLDEASLVNTRTLHRLLQHTDTVGGKLVLVGDPYQLSEIGAGGLFAALAAQDSTIELTGNHRQHTQWERDALRLLREGDPVSALDAYQQHNRIHTAASPENLLTRIAEDYANATGSGEDVLVLAARRSDVHQLNQAIREHLIDTGGLGPDELTILSDSGDRHYRTGDRVVVTVNDRPRGLVNGTRGTVTAVSPSSGHLQVELAGHRRITLDADWLATGALAPGYATTVHKAQGLTVDTTLVYGLRPLTREHGYVALSRGRSANHLYLTTDTQQTADCGPPHSDLDRSGRGATRAALAQLRPSRQQTLASSYLPNRQPELPDDDPYDYYRRAMNADRGYGRSR
jgi:conjugative relaxase-like TrwC/TraI family protein